MKIFSHRWYGTLIIASILGGIGGATYTFMKKADSQAITLSPGAVPVSNGLNGTAAGYPMGATVLVGSGTGTGVVDVTMGGGSVGKISYMCGFSVQASGSASYLGPIIVGGLLTEFQYDGSATVAGGPVAGQNWWPCLPASENESSVEVRITANPLAAKVKINMWGFEVPSN